MKAVKLGRNIVCIMTQAELREFAKDKIVYARGAFKPMNWNLHLSVPYEGYILTRLTEYGDPDWNAPLYKFSKRMDGNGLIYLTAKRGAVLPGQT